MARHSEIPKGYEFRGETREMKWGSKKDYSPKQIADRIRNPKENAEFYRSEAKYHHQEAESYADKNNLVKYREHEKKGDVYNLLAKKAKNNKPYKKSNEDVELEKKLDAILVGAHNDTEKIFQRFRASRSLENTLGVVAISGFLASLFFLIPNFTGNAIADLTTKTTSFFGTGLLVIGLVAGFFYLKNKKK